jgi:hypothetical protein
VNAGVSALAVSVPVLPVVPLVLFGPTRMWGGGPIVGAGLSPVALAGTCVTVVNSLSGNSV